MPTKHYRDTSGNYIGSFITESGDHPDVPAGAIECPRPPGGKAKWVDNDWSYTAPHGPARRDLYNEAGVTDTERLDALWDKLMESDSTKADALKVKRDAVRAESDFPAKT